MAPRVALASCRSLLTSERDDRYLQRAFEARGASARVVAWDADEDWAGYDLVLLRSTWDYVPRREEFCRWCEAVEAVTHLENSAALVRWNTDKRYLAELAVRGLATVPSAFVEGESLDVPPDWDAARLFLKPVVGAGSNATLRFERDERGLALGRAHLAAHAAEGPFLLQPYLERVEARGEVSLIYLGDRWTHAVRKIPVPGDWRVQDDHGASDEPHDLTPRERELARTALQLVGSPLYLRVDLLETAQGEPLVVELELVEPSLFFHHAPAAADVLAAAALARIGAGRGG
ncbi:MAG: hypothetical protein WD226_06785 [Planctomycetota bacterium]